MNHSLKRNKIKYNILRCFLSVIAALLALAFLGIYLFTGRESQSALRYAADAAQQTASAFQTLIDNSFRQMKITGNIISGDPEHKLGALHNLVESGNFTEAALISGGVQTSLDGTSIQAESAHTYATYKIDGIEARIVGDKDFIRLQYPVSNTLEIVADLDLNLVSQVMESVYGSDSAYALYNIATGAYLINATPFEDGGYYDALLHLNHAGSTEALMRNRNAAQAEVKLNTPEMQGRYFIAQQRTAIPSWEIALIIPEQRLTGNVAYPQSILILFALVWAILFACIIYFGWSIRKALHNAKVQRSIAARIADQLVALTSETSRSTMYVFNRKLRKIETFHDGLSICKTGKPEDIGELARACGLADADSDRLEDVIRELSTENHTRTTSCIFGNDDEKMLLFSLHSLEENADLIVGNIRDCTQEYQNQHRMLDEQNFKKMMLGKAYSIWQVNVSRNCWRLTEGIKHRTSAVLGIRNKNWRDYDNDLNGCIRDVIVPQDFNSYIKTLSRSALADAYMEGKSEIILDYKVCPLGRRDSEWYRLIAHLYADAETGHIMANLYVLNIDAEKNAEIERTEHKRILQKSLTALGSMYYGLYYVDLDRSLCYTAKSPGGELVTQLCTPFKSTFDDYAARSVHPDDRAAFQKLLDNYNIRKIITEDSYLAHLEYRRLVGEDYQWSAAIVQAARFENGTIREVTIALRNIDREKKAGSGWM